MTEPREEPRRILLVEDDARYAERLRRNLKLEGYEVDVAGDGLPRYARLAKEMVPKKTGRAYDVG